jgi:hypothetical protein
LSGIAPQLTATRFRFALAAAMDGARTIPADAGLALDQTGILRCAFARCARRPWPRCG